MLTDTLCYIMDYSGHYYRTNQANQLVAVSGECDAELFTFAQANSRINVGKKAAFYCVVPMEEETDSQTVEEEEEPEVDTAMEAIDESEVTVPEEDTTDECEASTPGDGPTAGKVAEISVGCVSTVKELTYDELTEQTPKSMTSYDLSEMDWTEYLTHFMYLVSGLGGYRDELSRGLSDEEQKICDILHYIELCETNDDEAADLIELLRVCRENRRYIKDELQRIEYFQINLGTNANAARAKRALKSIKGLETRKYRPRQYDELFENCIMKDSRLRRGDLMVCDEANDNRKMSFSAAHGYNEGGVDIMTEDRIYTSFDGRENDWLAFARVQADFYRNVHQYMTNLRLDIREIDEEIEAILTETEAANCNVAQGYKVFKRLKELRLARKAKSKELDCLYALTDYIDCSALADTCEANLGEIEKIMQVNAGNEEICPKLSDIGQNVVQESEDVEDQLNKIEVG